jgi:pilus assembly protein CpaC
LSALQRNQLLKVLAEPTLVTVSGRAAYFQSGGELPILIPQSLGTVSVDFRKFGTQVDFVPIVLGNGNVRLEVRPRVSEIDNTIGVTLNGTTVPGFRTREVDTGVELKVGQTLALAGLIQSRTTTEKSGLPWLSDLPYLGVPFRRMKETVSEVELLITVRPELVEGLDPEQVPPCGPGQFSTSPKDGDFYIHGYLEVPKACPGCDGGSCGNGSCGGGVPQGRAVPQVEESQPTNSAPSGPAPSAANRPAGRAVVASATKRVQPDVRQPQPAAARPAPSANRRPTGGVSPEPSSSRSSPLNPSTVQVRQVQPKSGDNSGQPGFIGPVGYDVSK